MEQEYQDISVEQVRRVLSEEHERDFLLVDVRQPDEYRKGHIPGSVLLPLNELPARLDELPRDRMLVFYCHSGRRSRAAALLAGSPAGAAHHLLYNMLGGMVAWNGLVLSGVPELRSFAVSGQPGELFLQAMELERGAERFYALLLNRLTDETIKKTIAELARAEKGHARILHQHLLKVDPEAASFESMYSQLEGNIVEGGRDIDTLLACCETSMDQHPFRVALEIALDIECTAYDMYRNLSRNFAGKAVESVFLEIAQAEKAHIAIAAEALSRCQG